MRILVTGGAGFIGSSLVDRLLAMGHKVVCLDNFDAYYEESVKTKNLENAGRSKSFTLIKGDIRNPQSIEECFARGEIELVVHLAAKAGVRASLLAPEEFYDVNVIGTLRLLEIMRRKNVKKLVFASSSSVYGNSLKIPFSETDNVDYPVSPYAASKKAGELLCHTYHHLHGFSVFCLRFFTVYGPRQRPDMAIHKFAKNIFSGLPITMYGDGSTKRDYTFIDDILGGVVASIQNMAGFEILNLGESKTISLRDLISLLEEKIGKRAIIQQMPEQPGDVTLTNADISKARRLIGYNPLVSIEQGLSAFVQWYARERGIR